MELYVVINILRGGGGGGGGCVCVCVCLCVSCLPLKTISMLVLICFYYYVPNHNGDMVGTQHMLDLPGIVFKKT